MDTGCADEQQQQTVDGLDRQRQRNSTFRPLLPHMAALMNPPKRNNRVVDVGKGNKTMVITGE